MAHELEIIDGVASFASFRTPAWHNLGDVFTDEKTTAEMLHAARLDNWNVSLETVPVPEGFDSDKNYYFVTRTNPVYRDTKDILGVVGERYKVLQNEQLFDFADTMLDFGGRWETAGSIRGGRVVFGAMAYERETVLDPNGVSDVVKTYLLVNTSHDGSVAIQASVTPVRVVCANTLNMALKGAKQSFKIRHTQTAEGKVQAARDTLGIMNAYMDKFDEMARELFETPVTKDDFWAIIERIYPRPEKDSKGSVKKWEAKVDLLEDIYGGPTNGMIAGTKWGVFNALTERIDWHRSARGGNSESIYAAASGFDAAVNADKNKILEIVKAF